MRITSHILKFTNRLLLPSPYTTSLEMLFLSRLSQLVFFQKEILLLQNKMILDHKSSLLALNPFLDENGVLRVGGRLENATILVDRKHPIILHRHSQLINLLVQNVHKEYFHANPSFIIAHIQSRYWVHGRLNRTVKKIINNCLWCIRMKAKTMEQLMSDVPTERTHISRPFAYISVDFAPAHSRFDARIIDRTNF